MLRSRSWKFWKGRSQIFYLRLRIPGLKRFEQCHVTGSGQIIFEKWRPAVSQTFSHYIRTKLIFALLHSILATRVFGEKQIGANLNDLIDIDWLSSDSKTLYHVACVWERMCDVYVASCIRAWPHVVKCTLKGYKQNLNLTTSSIHPQPNWSWRWFVTSL